MTDEARRRAAHEAIRGIEQLADRSWADPLLLLFDAAAVALKVKPEEEAYYRALETMKPVMDILERRVVEALRREPASDTTMRQAGYEQTQQGWMGPAPRAEGQREDVLLLLRQDSRSRRTSVGVPAPRARSMTGGRGSLVAAIGAWTGLAPGYVVGLLAIVLLIAGWIIARAQR